MLHVLFVSTLSTSLAGLVFVNIRWGMMHCVPASEFCTTRTTLHMLLGLVNMNSFHLYR